MRTHQYTLYMHRSRDSVAISLWDRLADPYQMKNIADEKPELVESLFEQELKPWLEKTNDPWLGKL